MNPAFIWNSRAVREEDGVILISRKNTFDDFEVAPDIHEGTAAFAFVGTAPEFYDERRLEFTSYGTRCVLHDSVGNSSIEDMVIERVPWTT